MQVFNISELTPHPKNTYFFDDMEGQKFEELKESIRIREEKQEGNGIIEPIVITQDKTIVSGHQRVRACKELGITTIRAEVKVYEDEDEVILDLIETNIRQRGEVGGSDLKLGRRIDEIKRIKGNKVGRPSKENSANGTNLSDKDIAEMMGISLDTLKRAKKLTTLPEEIQNLVESNTISASAAVRVIGKLLSKDEQKEFAKIIVDRSGGDKKYTQREMENIIKQWKYKLDESENEKREIQKQKIKTVTEKVEVDKPETLAKIEQLRKQLDKEKEDNKNLSSQILKQNEIVGEVLDTLDHKLVSDCTHNSVTMMNFIKEMSPYDYMAESLCNLPISIKNEYKRCVVAINKWSNNILSVIDGTDDVIDMDDIESSMPDFFKVTEEEVDEELDRLLNR